MLEGFAARRPDGVPGRGPLAAFRRTRPATTPGELYACTPLLARTVATASAQPDQDRRRAAVGRGAVHRRRPLYRPAQDCRGPPGCRRDQRDPSSWTWTVSRNAPDRRPALSRLGTARAADPLRGAGRAHRGRRQRHVRPGGRPCGARGRQDDERSPPPRARADPASPLGIRGRPAASCGIYPATAERGANLDRPEQPRSPMPTTTRACACNDLANPAKGSRRCLSLDDAGLCQRGPAPRRRRRRLPGDRLGHRATGDSKGASPGEEDRAGENPDEWPVILGATTLVAASGPEGAGVVRVGYVSKGELVLTSVTDGAAGDGAADYTAPNRRSAGRALSAGGVLFFPPGRDLTNGGPSRPAVVHHRGSLRSGRDNYRRLRATLPAQRCNADMLTIAGNQTPSAA